MDAIVAGDGSLDQPVGHDRPWDREDPADPTMELGSWMMILGLVRILCALGAFVAAFLQGPGTLKPTFQTLVEFVRDDPPLIVVGSIWPLALGFLLRRTRDRAFLPAAAFTFFILSIGSLLGVATRVWWKTEPTLIFGGFEVSRWELKQGHAAAVAQALLGSIELVLELATAMAALKLILEPALSLTSEPESRSQHTAVRRGLEGRLAFYVSLALLVLYVRVPLWSVYEEVLNRSTLVREFVLRHDTRPYEPHRGSISSSMPQHGTMELAFRMKEAVRMAAENRVQRAKEAYEVLIARAESLTQGSRPDEQLNAQLAQALNNLAWLLVTCENPRQRQPGEALMYAKRAVELSRAEGNYWNTLGVVWYRLENLTQASHALEQSMQLRRGEGDSYDWFFLAMIEAREGRMDQARRWYDRAVAWAQQDNRLEPELFRFQVEAAEALGLERPREPEPSLLTLVAWSVENALLCPGDRARSTGALA
jgi:tetratricopeptide (TPR) repeat protein